MQMETIPEKSRRSVDRGESRHNRCIHMTASASIAQGTINGQVNLERRSFSGSHPYTENDRQDNDRGEDKKTLVRRMSSLISCPIHIGQT